MSETRYFSPSQKAWMFGSEKQRMLMGGWRAGKTFAACQAGLFLSHNIPGNVGFIGRATGKDLTQTTLMTFDEVCPPELILKQRKIGQFGREMWIRSIDPLRPSKIIFDYIVDRQTGKSHIAGMNLGWFAVGQVEEIQRTDWIKLCGRLSLKGVKKHALGEGNPNGHDWIYDDFYAGGDYKFDFEHEPKRFYKEVRRAAGNLGVIVRSEENRISNGGFVEDSYYDDLRKSSNPQWVARYLDSSFDDFNGKIYSDYTATSVHNIEPFDIPSHWPRYAAIDPGGNVPWGVIKAACDEDGNIIIVDDAEPLYRNDLNPNTVIAWIKQNIQVDRTRLVIDHANKAVMIQLSDEGIVCEPAMKDIFAGLAKTTSMFYPVAGVSLPRWYERTQPKTRYESLSAGGSPKVFIFNTCKNARVEFENYVWDLNVPNKPKRGQMDHIADCVRYLVCSNPSHAIPLDIDPFASFRTTDPISAAHLDSVRKEIARLTAKDGRQRVIDAEPCDGGLLGDGDSGIPQYIGDYGGY